MIVYGQAKYHLVLNSCYSNCFFIVNSAPLDGKNKAVEVHSVTPLVGLLKDSSPDVKASAAGALMM